MQPDGSSELIRGCRDGESTGDRCQHGRLSGKLRCPQHGRKLPSFKNTHAKTSGVISGTLALSAALVSERRRWKHLSSHVPASSLHRCALGALWHYEGF